MQSFVAVSDFISRKLQRIFMYTIYDYAYNGYLYLNNIIWPRHKRLSQLMIYSTTACQSRCKHCNIWQKPVEHLSLEDIKRIMQSRCVTKQTTVGLEGGEFILHPLALNWQAPIKRSGDGVLGFPCFLKYMM